MRIFFSLALIGLFTSFYAQEIVYPYNPDANNDQYVAVSDVLSTVSAFGSEFLPAEIIINNTELTVLINQLQTAIINLQSESESQGNLILTLNQQIGVLTAAVNNLQALCQNCGGVDLDLDGVFDYEDSCIDLEACNYNANPTENCLFLDAIGECGGECNSDNNNNGICDESEELVCDCVDEYEICYEEGEQQNNICTTRVCTLGGWGPIVPINGNMCDDGDACTYMDMCMEGECVGNILNCDDGDATTYDTCVEGSCIHTPID